jgi:hypothetical protein
MIVVDRGSSVGKESDSYFTEVGKDLRNFSCNPSVFVGQYWG